MGPLSIALEWSSSSEFLGAFLVGIAFGFFLEQGGFGNARKLALTFYFRDMTVVKVMFTAIVVAMIGSLLLSHYGYLDMDAVWLNPTYLWSGLFGAVLMGFGFAIGGYCPGTAVVGCATLKTDAFFNIGGALLGMLFFGEIYPLVEKFYLSGHLGDRATLPAFFGISPGVVGAGVIVMALVLFIGSEALEAKFGKKEQ
ncbi:MAG: YeeE/YedE family protein [Oligoflexia bacterium]|nr:YeeE/YedE family protein [Oligoflexia bacterium]